jgi:hypothetical protein
MSTDLHERAARLGHCTWVERRCFEILGAWSSDTTAARAAVHFGTMSRRHGWHAELLRDRLPELASVDAESLVRAPGDGTERLMDGLAACGPDGDGLARCVGTYQVVLPVLVGAYRELESRLSPVAEPSLARWLRIVIDDDLQEWADGELLLRSLLVDEAAVDAASQVQHQMELLALRSSGLRA